MILQVIEAMMMVLCWTSGFGMVLLFAAVIFGD